MKECPNCGAKDQEGKDQCQHCGFLLNSQEKKSSIETKAFIEIFEAVKTKIFNVTSKKYTSKRNAGLSAFLSASLPGLGQTYNGLTLRGSFYLIVLTIIFLFGSERLYTFIITYVNARHTISFSLIKVNIITAIIFFSLYLHCIIDAYITAGIVNKSLETIIAAGDMDLKKCKECGHDVTTGAKECPNCGVPIKGEFNFGYIIVIAIVFIVYLNNYPRYQNYLNELKEINRITKLERLKILFNENIEYNYKILLSLYNSNKYDEASEIIGYFNFADQLNYKDVKSIKQKITIHKLETKLKPVLSVEEKLKIYEQLLELDPHNSEYKNNIYYLEIEISQRLKDECYKIGYWNGRCATRSMKGLSCEPGTDFIIPVRCRGKGATQRGINAGVRSVY